MLPSVASPARAGTALPARQAPPAKSPDVTGFLRGNTDEPGSPSLHFRGWLVGPLAEWAGDDPEKTAIARTARVLTTQQVGVKFRLEREGATGLARDDDGPGIVTLALLITGRLRITLRERSTGKAVETELSRPGDFLAWPSSEYTHTWESVAESRVATIRWPEAGSARPHP